MKKLLAIAIYTFRDAVRNKVLYSILFFAVGLIGLSLVMGAASMNQDIRILTDIGFFALFFFSNVIAIFLGVTTVFKELEQKTIYAILANPVPRGTYFMGKFAGMALTLAVQFGIMLTALLLAIALRGDHLPAGFASAVVLTYAQSLVVLSFAQFFASFSTPYVSGFLTGGLWVVGNMLQELEGFIDTIDTPSVTALLRTIVTVGPELTLFTVTTQVTYGIPIPTAYVVSTLAYGAAYGGAFLLAGMLIFSRRDFI